jgi:type IV pilus assembly protein PilM
MGLLDSRTRSVVGLDIEPGFLAAAEFNGGGKPSLVRAATETLGPGLFHEGEVVDVDGLADRVKAFFKEHDLPKRIRLGVASQKIALRVLELPAIDNEQELEAAIRFQAQEELPMPLEQAVLDYHVLERVENGEGGRMRVVVVGARRDTVEHLLAVARKAGLQPELVDLSAFAMIRALYVPPGPSPQELASADYSGVSPMGDDGQPVEMHAGEMPGEMPLGEMQPGEMMPAEPAQPAPEPATLYCYFGGLTNLAIGTGQNCVFNRVLQNGVESMAATLAERRGLTLDHSREWLRYVGMSRAIDGLEGEPEIVAEAREVLTAGARRIADEIRLSIEYYHTTVPDARRVEQTVMAGPGIAIEGLPAFFETELGMPVQPRSMGQIEVEPGALDGVEAAELTVATGLALDEVPS